MSSAAVIVISSSPPRTFAQSPTPAASPSPFESPNTPIRDYPSRLKSSGQVRDRFSGGFSSARALFTRAGAENIPVQSPGSPKFRSRLSQQSQDGTGSPMPPAKVVKKKTNATAEQLSDHFKPSKLSIPLAAPRQKVAPEGTLFNDADAFKDLSPPRLREPLEQSMQSSPPPLEKAVPRRLDWTPVKSNEDGLETGESRKQLAAFSSSLLSSYAFKPATNISDKITTNVNANGGQLKRKRIDIIMATEATPASPMSNTPIDTEIKRAGKGKGKASAKRALTITGLSTSAYRDGQEMEKRLPPMVDYLTATQAAAGSESESVIDVGVKKLSKGKARTTKASRPAKASAKTRLVSPTSAMKTTLEQPLLFGPASQLALDESPTLVRDTLEALKRSEEIPSDPFSPQRTQPFSIESTSPQAARGTSRYVKRRNLWGAAGRDADNALLQVETVDMTDSPAVREALTGKDALLQLDGPNHLRRGSVEDGPARISAAQTPHTKSAEPVIDIYDIDTPGLPRPRITSMMPPARAMHTSRALMESRDKSDTQPQPVDASSKSKNIPPKPEAVMPCYEGWADHDLKRQIAEFGFKPVKKREKMVQLLERCWESNHNTKHGSDQQDETVNALTHGDFLTKVHDVSARRTPKTKKPRAKRKSDSGDPATPKEPKKRKEASAKQDTVSTKEKAPRKRASKKKGLPDEKVMDIDDIDEHLERAASVQPGIAEMSNKAEQRQTQAKSVTKRPTTPPPTIPQLDFTSSSPAVEALQQRDARATINVDGHEIQDPVLTPKPTPLLDIAIQIHAAINHRPDTWSSTRDPRNHQTSPTWREKILMYDPIVLEELTAWLNTEGFRAIGEDREVSPLDVRDWCEQNGVCCIGFGGGWRGRGKRSEGE